MKKRLFLVLSLLLCGCDNGNVESVDNTPKEIVTNITFDENYLSNNYVYFGGKSYFDTNKGVTMSFSNTYIDVYFEGSELKGTFQVTTGDQQGCYITYFVDDEKCKNEQSKILITSESEEKTIVSGLENKEHHVRIVKINEACDATLHITDLKTDGTFLKDKKQVSKHRIEFIGDSITAGWDVEGKTAGEAATLENCNSAKTYAFFASSLMQYDYTETCVRGWGMYTGWTSDPKGNTSRIPSLLDYADIGKTHTWDYNNFIPDIVVINLGTNDGAVWNSSCKTTADKKAIYNGFVSSYKACIDKLISQYGDETIFVLSYNLMELNATFSKAIEDIAEEYGENYNCYSLKYEAIYESSNKVMPQGHPNVDMNYYAATELISLLSTIIEI